MFKKSSITLLLNSILGHRKGDKRSSPLSPALGGKQDTSNFPDQRMSFFQISFDFPGEAVIFSFNTESVAAF